MSSLKLCLLGPPHLERDGVPLVFDTRKNIALIAYLSVSRYVLEATLIVGPSMHPTLRDGDRYIISHWPFYFRTPRRGEIVWPLLWRDRGRPCGIGPIRRFS